MRYHVLTLFPEMIREGMNNSIMKRAQESGAIALNCINIRDFSNDKHGSVDDYPYGGGAGMLMQAQPVYDAWKSIPTGENCRTIYLSPKGKTFDQKMAEELAEEEDLIFLCGHYEGIDERVLEEVVTDYVSIGDFVLTGGELPCMVMMDCIARLVPDVLNNQDSASYESFQNDLLEYPQYSRPEVWQGKSVPAVLLSGNHRDIVAWQKEAAEEVTRKNRPDLYQNYLAKQEVISYLSQKKRENACVIDVLKNGFGELLGSKNHTCLVYDRASRYTMLFGDNTEDARALYDRLPSKLYLICTNMETVANDLCKRLDYEVFEEVYQSVYTKKEKLPIAYKDIRPLSMEHYSYVAEHYMDGTEADYVKNRILHHAMFGAFVEEKLAGFCGIHKDGSLGMVYIDPAYRRLKLGSSLSSYLCNIALDRNLIPYAHILTSNEKSLGMQDKMGLYLSTKVLYWLRKKDLQDNS